MNTGNIVTATGNITKHVSLSALVEIPRIAKIASLISLGKMKFPTIVYLHSAGGSDDPRHAYERTIREYAPAKYREKFIFVTPVCPVGTIWHSDSIAFLIRELIKKYPIDKNRVILSGHSLGGRGTWSTAIEYPELFSALIPLCGYSCYLAASKLKDIPAWAFHSRDDFVVPFDESVKMIRAMRAEGNQNAKLTAFENAGHSIKDVYTFPSLYEWMLRQKKVSHELSGKTS